MIVYALIFLAFLALYLLFCCYIIPKKRLASYADQLRKAGYRVRQEPFTFLDASYSRQFKTSEDNHGDAYYNVKKNYCNVDVVVTNILDKILVLLINPIILQEFFKPDKLAYYKKSKLLVGGISELLGQGIGFSDGQQWRRKRKAITKLFNYDLVKANIPKICSIMDTNLDKIESISNIGSHNQYAFNIGQFANATFMSIMMRCFFGGELIDKKVDGDSFQMFINKVIIATNQVSISPLVMIFGKYAYKLKLTYKIRSVLRNINIFKSIASQFVERRIKEIIKSGKNQGNDIISSLVKSHQNNKQLGNQIQSYSYNEVFVEFCSNLVAGTDTTSHLLIMMVYYYIGQPEVQKKLKEQVDRFIKTNEDITYDNISKCCYLKCFQNEVTRMYGPGNGILLREVTEDHYIDKIPIPKGVLLTIMTSGNHYNPEFYKDPHVFRPERWQTGQCESNNPFAFLGFGGGPRACLGKHLALLQTKIGMIKLIQRYKSIKLPKQQYKMIHSFLYEPEYMKTIFTKKKEDQE